MTKSILITGANGYLGSRLADSYNEPAIRWQRSMGDLQDEKPFASLEPGDIEIIIHSAAITRFNVEKDLAQAINVEGTRKLIAFAKQCPRLKQFVLVSSIYASGLQAGTIGEVPLEETGNFANHYEESKWQCEQDVRNSDLPWRIARVATVVSDTVDGYVSQFNAVHNTLKLFYYGMLSLVPGFKDTLLYFTTGDFVTTAIRSIVENGRDEGIYHVSPGIRRAVTLGNLVESSYHSFHQDEGFRRRRVLRPLYCDIDSFLSLSDTMISFGQGVMSQASASIVPFAKQLFVRKEVCTDELQRVMPEYEHPDMNQVLPRICASLIRQKWGREQASYV